MRYTQPTPSLRRPSRILAKPLVVCLFLFTTHPVLCEVLAAEFTGQVVSVLDGNTIKMSRSHHNVRIRLNGIDAPEKGQAYGHQSAEFVATHAFLKEVTVQTYWLDKYGRTIGDVYLPDGILLNKELVKAGLAWWYCKYSADQITGPAGDRSP